MTSYIADAHVRADNVVKADRGKVRDPREFDVAQCALSTVTVEVTMQSEVSKLSEREGLVVFKLTQRDCRKGLGLVQKKRWRR